jgi:hypothetical protein
MLARVPLSGDVITYLVSETYDARSTASVSTAERQRGSRPQRKTSLLSGDAGDVQSWCHPVLE